MAVATKDVATTEATIAAAFGHPYAHTIIRKITPNPDSSRDEFTILQVDDYLKEWAAAGYVLLNTHYLGRENDAQTFAYIMVKGSA